MPCEYIIKAEGRRRLSNRGCGDLPSEEQPGSRYCAHGRVDVLASHDVACFQPTSHVANLGEGCTDACDGGRRAFP
jgi:hypothetical protein